MKKFVDWMLGKADSPQAGTGQTQTQAQAQGQEQGPEHTRALLPPGRRLYCIGDIHGRLDLLHELHDMICADAEEYPGSKGLVYLGDYIDRGSQSKQVIDLLIEQRMRGFEVICLLGNHERAMLDFLAQPQSAAAWLDFGGQITLLSYGIGLGRAPSLQQLDALRDELASRLPGSHLEFLNSCPLMHIEGDYCFVHAGIRPGVVLEQQADEDLLWIRDAFIRSQADHGHVVVHGHSISEEVEWRPNRIGIDTGAFYTGLLTALVLEGDQQRLLQTGRGV